MAATRVGHFERCAGRRPRRPHQNHLFRLHVRRGDLFSDADAIAHRRLDTELGP